MTISVVVLPFCDDLLEASVPAEFKDAGPALAVDWTNPVAVIVAGDGQAWPEALGAQKRTA